MNLKKSVVKILALVLILAWVLSGCNRSDMPFNGAVTFHDLTLTIPSDFIRDSTESTDDLWIFEKGRYTQYILLSRQDGGADAAASLDSYADYLTEQGAQATRGTFLEMEAVMSSWTREGLFCQELLFAYNGSLYAISLRGGTEADFDAIVDTVELPAASQPTA